MTASKQTTAEKATTFAREVSENGRVAVVFHGGVFWLVLLPLTEGDCTRTLHAVGTMKTGIRYIREQIATYFEGK